MQTISLALAMELGIKADRQILGHIANGEPIKLKLVTGIIIIRSFVALSLGHEYLDVADEKTEFEWATSPNVPLGEMNDLTVLLKGGWRMLVRGDRLCPGKSTNPYGLKWTII